MKKLFHEITFFLSTLAVLIAGCSGQTELKSTGFPLDKGTSWVYSYHAYDTSATDPDQIIKAAYQLTETVVEKGTASQYVVAHVKREYQLMNSDFGWTDDLSNQPSEFWYVVNDNQVFQSNQPLDTVNIKLKGLVLDYQFPLFISKGWCWLPQNSKDAKGNTDCEVVGKRQVTSQGSCETLAGDFNDCYDLIDYSNGGNIFQKFCSGVGVVYMKFDHAGTRFGYEKTLISYSLGNQ